MSRNGRYLMISLIVVVATVTGMVLIVPSGASVASDVRRSAQRTSPDGVAAWARSLDSLNRTTALRFSSYARTPPAGEVEVLLDPIVPPTSEEAAVLMGWMRAGGILVVSPGLGSSVLDSLDIGWERLFDAQDPSIAPHRWTAGLDADEVVTSLPMRSPVQIPVRRGLRSDDDGWVPLVELAELVEPAPEPDSALDTPSMGEIPESESAAQPVRTLHATIGWRPVGAGGVVALADGGLLSNEHLATTPEAVVATRAVLELAAPGARITFSEFHQDIRGTGSAAGLAWSRLNGHPLGRVIVWAVLLGGFALWAGGRRFGGPIPQDGAPRRSPIEHVTALAEIYRQAGADRIVADRLVTGAARRAGLDTRLAVDPERALEWWDTHAERHGAAERSRAAWEREPPDLRALSDALDDLVPTVDAS